MSNRHPSRTGIAGEHRLEGGRRQYRGTAYDKRAKRHPTRPWTPHLAEARAWRVDALARLQNGTLSADLGPTVREAVDQFLRGIESGAIRDRKRSALQAVQPSAHTKALRDRAV